MRSGTRSARTATRRPPPPPAGGALDNAGHEPREVERVSGELYEPGAKARHLEDLIGEPKHALGALSDDAGESLLLLREGAGSALVKKVDGTTDRREGR